MPAVLTDKRNWFDTDSATSYPGAGGARIWKTAKNAWVLEDGGTYAEQPPAAAEASLPTIWDERSI